MTHALRAACVVLSLLWVQTAVAEPTVRDLAARTEVHPIQTLTVSVRQFLTGDQDGKPVTIAGHLRFPQAASGRSPAVILQHGSPRPYDSFTALPTTTRPWRRAGLILNDCALRARCRADRVPDAHPSFDNPLGNKLPTISKGSQSFRGCKLKEEPLGTMVHAESGERFSWKDPCFQTDPHTGYNEVAASAARVAVKDFVRTLFKLER